MRLVRLLNAAGAVVLGSSPRGGVMKQVVFAGGFAAGLVFSGLPSCGDAAAVAIQVSSQSEHTCALISDGSVHCWGKNDDGQLGDGTQTWRSHAVAVAGLNSVVKVAAGGAHTCALRTDGTVWCWGKGDDGQIDGATASHLAPTRAPISGASDVAVGYGHSCAVVAGKVLCWGSNMSGQLGTGTRDPEPGVVTAAGVSGALAVTTNYGTCALLRDGRVQCWGGYFPNAPTFLSGVSSATSVALDGYRVCVVMGGALACVYVDSGAMNTVVMSAARNFVSVSSSCAVVDTGAVACFGLAGLPSDGLSVIAGLEARSVTNGATHSCAALLTGEVRCWGERVRGKLGDGWVPTYVSASGVAGATALAVGAGHTCVVVAGEARCWGRNDEGQLGNGATAPFSVVTPMAPVAGLGKATAIAVGEDHTCAIVEGGEVKCWGANDHGGYLQGMLGDGTTYGSPLPVSTGIQGASSLALSEATSCAVSGGGVLCWGFRLFDPDANVSLSPLSVPALAGATDVSVGSGVVCGRYADGHVACVGDAAPAGTFKSISVTRGYGCGIQDSNVPWCWGGSGVKTFDGLATASAAVAGVPPYYTTGHYGCALAGGAVHCWGDDMWNELGDGYARARDDAQPVVGIAGATLLGTQKGRSCAVLESGEVRCWGLGDPSATVAAPGRFVVGLN